MKNFLTILLGIACVAVLIFGHSYWNQKIEAAPKSKPSTIDTQDTTTKAVAADPEEPEMDLLSYTANWPVTARNQWKQAIEEKRKFKVLFVGSPAIGSDTAGAYPIVKKKLLDTFGPDHIQVGIETFNTTSTQVVHSDKQAEVATQDADLIVLEPFILLNNGNVITQNTFKDIHTIMDDVKAKNPNVTFILQPSYPLYKAKIYPRQVEELKKFAEENKITYLDHWTAWPDPNSDAIKDYLQPDQSAPSEKGNQVWSEYLLHYLINQ